MAARLSVLAALAFAVRFVPPAWAGAGVFLLAAMAGVGGRVLAGRAGPLAAASAVLAAALAIVAAAALYRLALRRTGAEPPGGLAGAAGRLAAAQGLLTALTLVLGVIALVVLLALAYAVASTGPGFVPGDPDSWARAVHGPGRWVLGSAAAVAAASLGWLQLRLSLSAAATVARGRVQVLSAWPLTRGAVLPILVAVVAANAAPLAALVVAGRLLGGPWSAGAAQVSYAAVAASVVGGFMLPLNVGLMTYLYSQVAPSGAARSA